MAEKKKIPEAVSMYSEIPERTFSKEQLLSSERFRDRRDMLEALLADGERYPMKAVEQKMEDYRKGKVK